MTESKATDKEREALLELTNSSDIEGMIALLDDDAAQIRKELAACRPNGEGFIAEEWADNMIRAAGLLRKLAEDNYRVAQLLLDQDREGAMEWARGTLINIDEHGGLTASVDALSSRDEATADAKKVALDIAKWFIQGDRPDEWKLKEWAETLDRNAISRAYDWLAQRTSTEGKI